jgi:hypothetical protein
MKSRVQVPLSALIAGYDFAAVAAATAAASAAEAATQYE